MTRHTTLVLTLAILLLALPQAGFAQQNTAPQPLYVVTHIDIIGPHLADATKLLQEFVTDSRKDPGSVRFELLQELSRRNHFTMVEIWQTRQAFEDHLAVEHSRRFREKLQPMLGSPFDERLHSLMQ
jgi:quinol monooxygenase YgiN